MPSLFKIISSFFMSLGLLGLILLGGCTNPSSTAPKESFLPKDNARNVLSFADTLDSVLPSVVRIVTVKKNDADKLALSGIGSGAVFDAEKGYVITNAHVVAGSDGALINVPDGRIVQALSLIHI